MPTDVSDDCPACLVKGRQLAIYAGGVASLQQWLKGPGARLPRQELAAALAARLDAMASQAQKGRYR